MRPEIWAEIRRLHNIEKVSISEISRRMNLDRKTVRQAIKREHEHEYVARDNAMRKLRRQKKLKYYADIQDAIHD